MIKPGRILFEMDGVTQAEAFEALRLANNKLPLHAKPISRKTEALAQASLLAAKKAKVEKKAAREAKQAASAKA